MKDTQGMVQSMSVLSLLGSSGGEEDAGAMGSSGCSHLRSLCGP